MRQRPPALFNSARVAYALAGALLLSIAARFKGPLEQSMASHMLLQIPALLIAGVLFAIALRGLLENAGGADSGRIHRAIRFINRRFQGIDEHGVAALTAFVLSSAYWMIPKALDDVLVSPAAEAFKFASLILVGMALPGALTRANRIIQLFFLGNFAAMTAIVGMLYQEAQVRLCNFYLMDDQVVAGQGLVALSVVIPLLWFLRNVRTDSAAHFRAGSRDMRNAG